MQIIAVCPNNKEHDRFSTTACVCDLWEVDKYGNYNDTLETLDVMRGPDRDNIWRCEICGTEAYFVNEDE